MTDLKRRQTLKTLTTGAMALTGASVSLLSSAALTTVDRNIELEVHYSVDGANDKLVMHNLSSKNMEVAMQFTGDVSIPGGQLDVSRLMQNGPVQIRAGETRRFDLARVARSTSSAVPMRTHGHQALRFPISDNIFIDNISVISDRMQQTKSVPLLMRKVV